MRQTIGFDATPLLGHRAGIGHYTGRLLASMLTMFPDWDYLLYSNRPLGYLEQSLSRARPVQSRLTFSRWLWMQFVLPGTIARSGPDLCHFTNAIAPVRQKKPFVLTIHDASLFLHSRFHPGSRLLAIRLLLPLAARRASAIITMSHSARRDLLRFLSVPADKINVIYEAAPDDFGPVADPGQLSAVRSLYGLPDQFILYVGTLEPRKNLVRLIRAYHKLRRRGNHHQLVLVGPQGWSMEGFYREIHMLGLADSIRILGYVPSEHLPSLYSAATIFVFPSLYEGFGLPPLEAMVCGTPVLSSNNSSLAEICGEAAYLVDPTDEDALLEGMDQLLNAAQLREELSRKGQRRAQEFSWTKAAQQTMALYRRVLHQ